MRNLVIAALLPVFFLTVLVVGFYFFARLGLTIMVNKAKLKRRNAKPATAAIKTQTFS